VSGEWRQRALKRVGSRVNARVEEVFAEPALSSDELESAIRENRLEVMQAVDPEARLAEELTLRLRGEAIPEGLLLPGTADPIVRKLQALVPSGAEAKVEFGLVGISAGSTVLHLRPVYSRKSPTRNAPEESSSGANENASELAMEAALESVTPSSEHRTVESPSDDITLVSEYSSAVDYAMQQLMQLVEAAERDEEFDAPPQFLAAFEDLVQTLEKNSVDVDFGWQADTGRVRTGRLTARGRAVTQKRMKQQVKRYRKTVRGYVTELRSTGDKAFVAIKASMNRKRGGYRIAIPRDELIRHALAFGEYVVILVNVEERVDPLTGKSSVINDFCELIERRTA
jgi:hypothetical protein